MEKTKGEQALSLIFKEGSILRDGKNFVGFLEHNYVFGYCYENSLVIRSIDNKRAWMLEYVKSCIQQKTKYGNSFYCTHYSKQSHGAKRLFQFWMFRGHSPSEMQEA